MIFLDFFAGIGGFRLGLERAGHTCAWSCELAAFPREVYAARFGRAPEGEDITLVDAKDLPAADLWCGGFPCQDLSAAGAGKRSGIDGERSGLVWTFLELARSRRPDWVLLENVPGLLFAPPNDLVPGGDLEPDQEALGEATGDATWLGSLLGALAELGFVGAYRVLDAQHLGVPQRRRRVFILARRAAAPGPGPAELLLEPEGVRGRARESRAARPGAPGGPGGGLASGGEGLIAFDMAQVTHPENRAACEPGSPAPSLAATGMAHVAYAVGSGEVGVRRLLPIEYERLQGFPDDWTLVPGASDAKRYKALGNAVAVPVIEWIGRRLGGGKS